MKRFRTRMFVILVTLVLAVEGVTMFAALQALEQDALDASSRDLEIGARVFRQLLATREEQLSTGVRVLADDFGFREAVATGDVATLRSVLANHGRRIDADLVAFIAPDGEISASTHALSEDGSAPLAGMLDRGPDRQTVARTVLLPDGAFQLVVTPVYAPQLIGWIGVGFSVDDALAAELGELTGLDVTFLSITSGGDATVAATTLPATHETALPSLDWRSGRVADEPAALDLGEPYLSLGFELAGGARSVFALLQRPLSDALSGYQQLFDQLLAIFIGTVVIAVVAAGMVANGVTRPVTGLAEAARRIAGGHYDAPVVVGRRDEIGILGHAFNEMQAGIAERERRIIHQSRHDALTDLPNRLALHERTADMLTRARPGAGGALAMIDVRAFKAVNDTFGHETGDEALRELTRRLCELTGPSDLVARSGSNCFVVVTEPDAARDAEALVADILAAVEPPLALPSTHVRVRVTIGAVLFPEHGDEPETLLRRAEIAMYGARERGTDSAFYEHGQDEHHLRRLELTKELATAIERDELEIYFQPKLDLVTGRVEQAEALVRWHHRELGTVSPAEFVPIAEQSGLMRALTAAVLRRVARHLRTWADEGIDVSVSANISTIDLSDASFPDQVAALMSEHGVAPEQLQLEITESVLMNDPDHAASVLHRLRALGFRLSIDDFGTGYSSLVQLKRMPVSELKIDKSFVAGLPDDGDDAIIVRSTIELAHNLGLLVVAEGVEDERSLSYLRDEGCDLVQGFGIRWPQAAELFTEWLRARHDSTTQERKLGFGA